MKLWLQSILLGCFLFQVSAICKTKVTAADSIGEDESIWFLDRQHPKCDNKEVMTKFVFRRSVPNSDSFIYEYECCTNVHATGFDERTRTNCDIDGDTPGESGTDVIYLDRQACYCQTQRGSALAGFHLQRGMFTSGTTFTGVFYWLDCTILHKAIIELTEHTTTCDVQGTALYLDRHHVQCPTGKFLTGFRLNSCGSNGMHYKFTCGRTEPAADVCKVTKITPTSTLSFQDQGEKVVGLATAITCDGPNFQRGLSMSSLETVTESVSFEVENSESFSYSDTVSVGFSVEVEFFTFSASASETISGTSSSSKTFSNSQQRARSTSIMNAQAFKASVNPPGAVIVVGLAKQFQLNEATLPVEMEVFCSDTGRTTKVASFIKMTSTTYGQTFFWNEVAKFNSAELCEEEMVNGTCLKAVEAGNVLVSPQIVFDAFEACFNGKGVLL